MAEIITNKKSDVGSPYCYYTLTMTYSSRTVSTVKVSYTLKAHLAASSSSMGYSLTAYIYAGGYYHAHKLKGTSTWSGTGVHTFTGSFTVKGLSASTSKLSTALKVESGAPKNACQLNKYTGNSLTISTVPTYTITYNANGGTGAPSSQTKYYGTTLKLSSTRPTRSNYTFKGWGTSTTDTTVNWSAGGSYTTNASDTLYAIWAKTIKLTYHANGGSGAPSASSVTVYNATTSYSFSIKSTKPTRPGYNFKGWSKSSTTSPSADLYVYGESITLSSSDTLYAIWEKKTYKVTYNANGGTLPTSTSFINPQTKTYGVTLTLNTLKPSRANSIEDDAIIKYTFKGWASSSTATAVDYKPGDDYITNSNITLYAVWTENETPIYDIIYKTQGGSSVAAQEKIENQTITLRTTIPTRDGYTFNNKWNTKSDGTGTPYAPGASYSTNADLTLYAIWTPWTHTLKFDDNAPNETISIPSDILVTTGIDVSIPDFIPTRSGYIFYAWNTKADGSGTYYFPGSAYEYTQNGGVVTLYAIWISTDIIFYNNGICKAVNFEEESDITEIILKNDGTFKCMEFIEGSSFNINTNSFYAMELREEK